ncbi:MAG: DUF1573 domain-containing protein [Chitinophagaceae bacterium]|nr:DUF1573 domain-containing protein [Chitinophagaceae bacterium]
MRRFFFIPILFLFIMASCNIRNQREKEVAKNENQLPANNQKTTIKMIDSVFNFGKIKDGEKVVFSFRFENTGAQPLIIASASPTCGCTVADKPDQPVAPGERGFIKVVFDSKGRVGPVHKEVGIISNAEPQMPNLVLTGEVVSN